MGGTRPRAEAQKLERWSVDKQAGGVSARRCGMQLALGGLREMDVRY